MQQFHAAGVDIAGLGSHQQAGGAAIQTVDPVEGIGMEVISDGPGHGDRIVGEGGAVDGKPGGLIEHQQVLVLPDDVQRVGNRVEVGVVAGRV